MRALSVTILGAVCLTLGDVEPVRAGVEAGVGSVRQCAPLAGTVDGIGATALAAGAPGLVLAISQPGEAPVIRAWGQEDIEQGVPLTADSVFRIASLTKQFTAALVMVLVEEGRIGLDERVAAYLPEQAWLGDITVRQLLVQTAGLPDYAQDPAGEATRGSRRTSAEMLAWVGRLAAQPKFTPGERWAYSNSNYVVLGAVIERVTGQSFEDAMAARVLGPSGLQSTAVDDPADLVPHRVQGYSRRAGQLRNAAWIHPSMPGPAGALRSTAGDLLRWNAALYGDVILSEAGRSRMTAAGRLGDGRTTRFGMPQAWQDGLRADYAMGLFVSDSELGPRHWHSGDIDGFVTWMAHYPQTGVTIVMLQNGDFTDVDHQAVGDLVVADRLCRGTGRAAGA